MSLLRILTLPIALATFAILYTVAIKAPQAVEIGSLLLWMAFPLVGVVALIKRRFSITICG